MDRYREIWMRRTLSREARTVDMQIMAALQNGTAFFALTTLLAIGGALTIMRSTGEVLTVVAMLPFGIASTPAQWEMKTIGLVVIFIYAFFKFAWSYRLFNYVAIMLGAMPFAGEKNTLKAERHVLRTTRLFESAGQNFNRGQRLLLRARLSRMVRGPVAVVRLDHRGGRRDVAAAVRLVGATRPHDRAAGPSTGRDAAPSYGPGNNSELRPVSQ
jgi:hypothetical protein